MSVSAGGNGKVAAVGSQSANRQQATAAPNAVVVEVPVPTAKVAAQARKQRAKAAFGAPAKLDEAVRI